MHKGSCLCGAVHFEVTCALPPPDACHCRACRRQSGHFFVSTDVPRAALTIRGGENVTWYRSSDKVRRGFCSTCGSPLFFDPLASDGGSAGGAPRAHDWMGVAMGAFESPTGTRLAVHIHLADKGDHYDIGDGLPQRPH